MAVDLGAVAVSVAGSALAGLLVWKIRRDDMQRDQQLSDIRATLANMATQKSVEDLEKRWAEGVKSLQESVADKVRLTVLDILREDARRDR